MTMENHHVPLLVEYLVFGGVVSSGHSSLLHRRENKWPKDCKDWHGIDNLRRYCWWLRDLAKHMGLQGGKKASYKWIELFHRYKYDFNGRKSHGSFHWGYFKFTPINEVSWADNIAVLSEKKHLSSSYPDPKSIFAPSAVALQQVTLLSWDFVAMHV